MRREGKGVGVNRKENWKDGRKGREIGEVTMGREGHRREENDIAIWE